MKITRYLPSLTLIIIIVGFFVLINRPANNTNALADPQLELNNNLPTPTTTPLPTITEADRIDIIHFHGTNQCWSCIQLGDLAEATLEERFSSELESNKITFAHINGELPENKEITQLYQASGSSLFINAIKDGENHIREEVKIWQLINQEEKFKDYLENEIRQLL